MKEGPAGEPFNLGDTLILLAIYHLILLVVVALNYLCYTNFGRVARLAKLSLKSAWSQQFQKQ